MPEGDTGRVFNVTCHFSARRCFTAGSEKTGDPPSALVNLFFSSFFWPLSYDDSNKSVNLFSPPPTPLILEESVTFP